MSLTEMNSNRAAGHEAQRAVGERSEVAGEHVAPDPELVERPKRRRFSAEYKLAILAEADACKPGEIGALLRREGLYSSHLSSWRGQREQGALKQLSRPRGRRGPDPRDAQLAALERRAQRAESELSKARKVIEVQGNVSALLGDLLEPESAEARDGR